MNDAVAATERPLRRSSPLGDYSLPIEVRRSPERRPRIMQIQAEWNPPDEIVGEA
jgi:hypothetical protein